MDIPLGCEERGVGNDRIEMRFLLAQILEKVSSTYLTLKQNKAFKYGTEGKKICLGYI